MTLLIQNEFQVASVRQAGIFAKVNKIVITQQGNKFGVCDGDGNTALWQVTSSEVTLSALSLTITTGR